MSTDKKTTGKRGQSPVTDGAKKVTLSDVAQLADVSTMTVSKVIRNTGSISAPTRNRVNEAIESLGYLPNRIAGSLSSQTNLLVAVVIPSLANNVFGEVLRGIHTVLNGAGMHTIIGASNYHTDIEEELIRTMLPWQPRGLILTGGIAHSQSTDKLLAGRPCPIVQIWDNDVPEFDVNVGFSHYEAGRIIARHFIEKGYRKIGYVGSQLSLDVCALRRFQGFRDELGERGLSVAAEIFEADDRNPAAGIHGTQALLAQTSNLDAIFYLNDAMAIGGLTHLHRAGIPVPRQIAVAGFNGTASGQLISTDLTTVDIPRWKIGDLAARSLLERVNGKKVADKIDVEIELLPGTTT